MKTFNEAFAEISGKPLEDVEAQMEKAAEDFQQRFAGKEIVVISEGFAAKPRFRELIGP